MKVRVIEGKRVRELGTNKVLDVGVHEVSDNSYWNRRIRDKDVERIEVEIVDEKPKKRTRRVKGGDLV